MPTEQPSSAPDTIGTDARDDATIGAVLHDTDGDKTPGGGGLGGAAAGDPVAATGGTSPNSPIAVAAPHGDAAVEREARAQAATDAKEPHPGSL